MGNTHQALVVAAHSQTPGISANIQAIDVDQGDHRKEYKELTFRVLSLLRKVIAYSTLTVARSAILSYTIKNKELAYNLGAMSSYLSQAGRVNPVISL